MQEFRLALGQRMREARLKRRWSQEGFADIAGVHRTWMGAAGQGESTVLYESGPDITGARDHAISTAVAVGGGANAQRAPAKIARYAEILNGNLRRRVKRRRSCGLCGFGPPKKTGARAPDR